MKNIPETDKTDIIVQQDGLSSQFSPEYSQEVYEFIRSQEDSKVYSNYLRGVKSSKSDCIDESGRSEAIVRIKELWVEKAYKPETLYLAYNVLDKILSMTFKTLKRDQLPLLVVTCVIVAAKME